MARQILSDAQWRRIEALWPGRAGHSGAKAGNNRLFMEALLWVARTGSPWRDLPAELGNGHTTRIRFGRWNCSERWHAV